MKRADVDQLMEFLHSAFPRLTVEQIALYARLLEQEPDTDAASRAILRGVKEWKYPPSYADLHEYVKAEKRLNEPEHHYQPTARTLISMPNWVRRWVCARFLYARFGKEKDMRVFPEQMEGINDPGVTLMPPDEWAEEAAAIDMRTAWGAVLAHTGALE